MLTITEDCNMVCDYCFHKRGPRTMSRETLVETVKFLMAPAVTGRAPRLIINFFGGEPFLALDRMEEAIQLFRREGSLHGKLCGFTATTNGTVCGPRVERLIRDARMGLLVSLDGGPEANRYRCMRTGSHSHERVSHNLPLLVEWASEVVVRMTFLPQTLDLVGNVQQVLNLGAPAVALAPVLEVDWEPYEQVVTAAYERLADWYIEQARKGSLVPLQITHNILKDYHCHLLGGPRPARPCSVGTELIGVDPDGHVMPCHRFLHRPQDFIGHVSVPGFPGGRGHHEALTSGAIRGCQGCLAAPVCGGGCRAVVLEAGLGWLDTHPTSCLLTQVHARAAFRIYETLMRESNRPFLRMLGISPGCGATQVRPAIR